MTRRFPNDQSGMALVMVMGVLAVTMLLVVHILTISEVISRESFVDTQKYRLRIVAESAADHTFWMHLTDRRIYSNRELGQDAESRIGTELEEAWMADRRRHTPFLNQNCDTFIDSVEKSLRADKPDSFKENIPVDDTEQLEVVETFLDMLGDYIDSDSARKLNGKDADDYADEGLPAMPRNGELHFREEIYWIDGWENAVLGEITLIPPQGKSFPSSRTKPSFFSASEQELRRLFQDYNDQQIQQLLDAQAAWLDQQTPIQDSLDADTLVAVREKCGFSESAIAEYIAAAATPDGSVRTILRTVRQCNLSGTAFADSKSQALSVWRHSVH